MHQLYLLQIQLHTDVIFFFYFKLSSVESLCKPPYARDSDNAKRVVELLHTAKNTDMVFEIICVQGLFQLASHFKKEKRLRESLSCPQMIQELLSLGCKCVVPTAVIAYSEFICKSLVSSKLTIG